MLCDHSDFRLKLAEELGFAVCNPAAEDFAARAAAYFGTAPSLSGPAASGIWSASSPMSFRWLNENRPSAQWAMLTTLEMSL